MEEKQKRTEKLGEDSLGHVCAAKLGINNFFV